jgi:hypothetical protein
VGYHKQWDKFAEPKEAVKDLVAPMSVAARTFAPGAMKLVVLGEILGDDGKEFATTGDTMASNYVFLRYDLEPSFKRCVAGLVDSWKKRQEVELDTFDAEFGALSFRMEPFYRLVFRELELWVVEDLLMLPSPNENSKSCEASNTSKVPLADDDKARLIQAGNWYVSYERS